jgi:hypothetical protein
MDFSTKHTKAIFTGAALLFVAFIAMSLYQYSTKDITLAFEYTPQSAQVLLDGRRVGHKANVAPGEHTVTIKKDGFTEYTDKILVKEKNTKSTVRAVLSPNTEATKSWYQKNPKDSRLAQKITYEDDALRSQQAAKDFPIMGKLPHRDQKQAFRVDYGKGSKPGTHALYVSYYIPEARRRALDWIKSQGYSLDDYEIFYQEIGLGDL